MKRIYLILAIIGFILPNILVFKVSLETGNWFLYTDIPTTMQEMFANDISSIFMIDLLYGVLIFMIWSFQEAKKYQIKQLWLTWILTFLLGLAGGFPLFLYFRESSKTQ